MMNEKVCVQETSVNEINICKALTIKKIVFLKLYFPCTGVLLIAVRITH